MWGASTLRNSPWCWNPTSRCARARRALYLGMVALIDALLTHAPPESPIAIDWPDAIFVDGGLVGGGRHRLAGRRTGRSSRRTGWCSAP